MLKIKSFTNLFENLNNDLVKCGKLPEHVAYVMDGRFQSECDFISNLIQCI